MTDDFSGRVGDALLGMPDAEVPAPEGSLGEQTRAMAARSPEAELLDSQPGPPAKVWDEIERQLREEGVIRS